MNRVDDILFFRGLDRNDMVKILEIQLGYLKKRLEPRKIDLELTESAKELVIEKGFDPAYGARPLKRSITRLIENPISMMVLEGKVSEGNKVSIDVGNDGKLEFKIK